MGDILWRKKRFVIKDEESRRDVKRLIEKNSAYLAEDKIDKLKKEGKIKLMHMGEPMEMAHVQAMTEQEREENNRVETAYFQELVCKEEDMVLRHMKQIRQLKEKIADIRDTEKTYKTRRIYK